MRVRGPRFFAALTASAIPNAALKRCIGMSDRDVADAGVGSSKSIRLIGAILTAFLLSFVGDHHNVRFSDQVDNAPTALAHLHRKRGGAFEGLDVMAYDFPGV